MNKIAIHSVPRSGSSWLGCIFDSVPSVAYRFQPLFSYAFKGRLTETSSVREIDAFFADIYKSSDDFLLQRKSKELGIVPRSPEIGVRHIVYKEVRYHHILQNILAVSDTKVIGLIRNPLGVLNSWFKAPREFRTDLGWKIGEEWRYAHKKNVGRSENYFGYGKWKEVAVLFHSLQRKYPMKFRTISYTDLLVDSESQIKDLFEFCGVEYGKESNDFLRESRSRNVKNSYSVYAPKFVDSDWRQSLNEEIVREIHSDLANTEFERYLRV